MTDSFTTPTESRLSRDLNLLTEIIETGLERSRERKGREIEGAKRKHAYVTVSIYLFGDPCEIIGKSPEGDGKLAVRLLTGNLEVFHVQPELLDYKLERWRIAKSGGIDTEVLADLDVRKEAK